MILWMVLIFCCGVIFGGGLVYGRLRQALSPLLEEARPMHTFEMRATPFGTLNQSFEVSAGQMMEMSRRENDTERDIPVEKIRHADRLSTLGKLASSVAHELGNPLNVIAGNASMIASGELEAEAAKRAALAITEQSQRMTTIIRQILQYARPTKKEVVELNKLVQQAFALVRSAAQKNGVRLYLEEGNWSAEVDSGKLLQVLINLFTNGIQAMPEGGTLSVSASHRYIERPPDCHAAGEYLCISVRDEGVGISAEERAHIFEPFFTTKADEEGNGLGLWISQGIAREHNGFIEVESEVNRGSCFSLCLYAGDRNDARETSDRR